MRSFIFAIGTNNGNDIGNSHLGDTAKFQLFSISEDSTCTYLSEIINSEIATDEIGHGREGKMKAILKLLSQVDVLISRKMSPNFKKMSKTTKFQPIIIDVDSIETAKDIIKSNFEKIWSLIEKRRSNIFDPEILSFK